MKAREFLVIFHIDSPKKVNQLKEGGEIETNVVVELDIIEILKGMDGSIHSVDPRVGQLIILVVTTICNRYIGIPWSRCQ